MPNERLFEEVSPFGNIQAVVEVESQACYFYLFGAPSTEFGMRSVWVRNLVAAPEGLDVAAMRAGRAPLNPRAYTLDPHGSRAPRPADLRVVWFAEGNGAALLERDTVIAIIPPWSGTDDFHGYAAACVGEGPLAWAMPAERDLIERVRAAERYWAAWDTDAIWPGESDRLIASIQSALGSHSNYYAIDGGEWPPKAMLRIPRPDGTVFVTAGVSLVPQPNVELGTDDWPAYRRIELAAMLPLGWPDDAAKQFGRYISGQSRLPWNEYTWLGPGHTIPCDSWRNPAYEAALLVRNHPALGTVLAGTVLGDPAFVLWFLPITEPERQLAINQGSAALERRLSPDRWLDA
jgi:suppressor of fused protein SUFU